MSGKEVDFQFIEANKDRYSITELVRMTRVSRSGYYHWKKTKHLRISREERDQPLLTQMVELYQQHGGNLGNRRFKIALFNEFGIQVNLKRIARMRRMYDLPLKTKRRFRVQLSAHKTVGNLLNRNFKARKPGVKFSIDITYLEVTKPTRHFLYMCAIKDLFNNEIVAYRIGRNQTVELVLETVEALKEKGFMKGALLHSDQGTQFTNPRYLRRLQEINLIPSMSRRGNCWDNACIESFFGKLKTEMYGFSTPHTDSQMIKAVNDYVYYYNHKRVQLKLKMSPVAYNLAQAS